MPDTEQRRRVALDVTGGRRPAAARTLTGGQIAAIRAVMRLFVEDDLALGVSASSMARCDACRTARPAAGAIHYDGCTLCHDCAVRYEIARAEGRVRSAGAFAGLEPTPRPGAVPPRN